MVKYCLSSRQPKGTLQKADEIKLRYTDIDIMYDFIEEMPNKTYILDIPREESLNWDVKTCQMFAEKVDFILCIHDLRVAKLCAAAGIKWYWAYPVTTFYELQGVIALNPCYVYITAPLSMDLEKVKNITDIPLRMSPNLAYDAYIPRENGVRGQWVRPEDTDRYGAYIDTYEFATSDLQKERTLFHVYAENGEWPGNLNLLLTNLDFDIDNRTVPDEVIEARMVCGQRCMAGGRCRLCESAFNCMATLRHKYYEKKREESSHIQPQED